MRAHDLRRATALAFLLLGSAAGCAQIIGFEDTELAIGRDLSCVGRVPRPQGDGSAVAIHAVITNIATGMPIEGVRVVRCLTRLDAACTGTPYFSDARGLVEVPVTSGFNGYLRIEDPDGDTTDTGLVTYFWYFSEPIVETRSEPFPILAMTREFRSAALYGGDPNPLRGEMAINATDCRDDNAPGIRFEITTSASSVDANTVPFYFENGFVVPVEPGEGQTDGSGIGGFLGVRSGPVGILALRADTGVEVARDTFLVRPDVLTTVRLLPQ